MEFYKVENIIGVFGEKRISVSPLFRNQFEELRIERITLPGRTTKEEILKEIENMFGTKKENIILEGEIK